MAAKTYRKKPVVIEAVVWDGSNLDEVMQFCAGAARYELMARGNSELVIGTLEDGEDLIAKHVASKGDWIIKGVQGEFYPCKPDIFAVTYEPADTPPPQSNTHVDGERKFCDFPKCDCSSGAAERCSHPPIPAPEQRVEPFNKLCYGARFRYTPETKVWVKIGHDTIAEWDPENVATGWVGQAICSFSDDGDLTREVYLVN